MTLPEEGVDAQDWRTLLEQEAARYGLAALKQTAADLSLRYRRGQRVALHSRQEAVAYAAMRMPATYGAIFAALAALQEAAPDFAPRTQLDFGAGTGAAAFAAANAFPGIRSVSCVEAEPSMLQLGRQLGRGQPWQWLQADQSALGRLPGADLVSAAYVLNEVDALARPALLRALWARTQGVLLVVEPGTPAAAAAMAEARDTLLQMGAQLVAPCPHGEACPIGAGDWCHFRTRIARSALHRRLKEGDCPYEDEKFTYLLFARPGVSFVRPAARVLRHPDIRPGCVTLTLCTPEGVRTECVTRSHPCFKGARKCSIGAPWPPAGQ